MSNLAIGILGGGQLARMMTLEAHRLGMDCYVMSSNPEDPAAQVTNKWVQGDIDNLQSVKEFSKKVDVLTFESEFVKPEILKELSIDNTNCAPASDHMLKIQDRLSQKELLAKYDVPTSPFYKVDSWNDVEDIISKSGLPLVLKARLGGYDGKGTFILKDTSEASKSECVKFLEGCQQGIIGEHFIPFKRELAFSVARSSKGQVAFFPLVESHQEEYRCLWVKGPAHHDNEKELRDNIKTMLEKENYVGFISFEFFDSDEGLLVNEIAPRVHNSAHYSQNGLSLDQFSAHLKAITGEEVYEPQVLSGGFAMYNLIGSGKEVSLSSTQDIYLHWYGKRDNKKGRKMGHMNAVAISSDLALEKLKVAIKEIKI